MTLFMTTSIDAYDLQPIKHRAGLEVVAAGFAATSLTLPLDVHELFRRYIAASDTVVVPRMIFLQMCFDLQRAWEATGRDIAPGSHGEFYKTFSDVVGRIIDAPCPFPELEPADTRRSTPFSNGPADN